MSDANSTPPRAFVMGHPVAHSRSPMLHGYWLKHYGIPGSYERVDVAPDDLPAFFEGFREAGWAGGNVTVPHKLAVMRYANRIDDAAEAMGAVNTLWWDGADACRWQYGCDRFHRQSR